MKITKVEVLEVKTARPTWRPVYCRVFTDEGITGDGEAALAYGRAADAGYAALKEFAGLIIGMDPLKNEVVWDKLYKETFWGQNGGPVIFAAIGAIDIALWDIKGKYFNKPIHALLGENGAIPCGLMQASFRTVGSLARRITVFKLRRMDLHRQR